MTALLHKLGFFACWALLVFGAASPANLHAQCTNTTPFGTVTAPTNDVPVTITTCAFAGEYSTINSCVAGSTYRFNATGGSGNYVTVRQGTPGGTLLGHGFPPIDVVCTVSGPLYLHYNLNPACGTESACRTGTVQCISCVGANPCSSIANINCNTATSVTLSGSGAWNTTACGFSTPGNEKIYSFTPTTTGTHDLQVTSTNSGGYIDYFFKAASGGCNSSGWTCIDDIFSPTTVSLGTLTAGTTYYILLDAETTSSVTHTFQINCPTPADACSSITTINCNTAATATLSGAGSWNTTACGFSTPGNERIYSFTAASTGVHSLQVTSTNSAGYIDYFIKAASGGCNSSGWTCILDIFSPTTVSLGTLTAGTTYYILLDAETTSSVTHTFQILCPSSAPACVASPTSPTNGQTNICPTATQALSWPASGGATSYDVYFGTTNPPPFVANTTATSYTASTPTASTYFWQIRPVGPGGTASGCTVWSFTKIDVTLPTITCPANVTVNNAANQCGANVVYGSITASDNCGAPTITLLGGLASGSFFPVGITTNTWRATDPSGNTRTCTHTVTVNDVQPPTITCPPNIVRPNEPGKCSAVVTYANPTFADNCSATLSLVSGLSSGSTFPVGVATIVFRATDPAGNSSSCSFTVRVNDVEPPSITCPAPLNLPNDWGQCGRGISWVGQATVVDNCGAAANSNNNPGYFAVGSHVVVHTATDIGGNSSTCAQSITIYDAQPPQITCPSNIVTKTDLGDCVATISYSATGWDNCAGATMVYSEDSPGSFGIGYSNVTVSITDLAGNVSSCAFQVRVDARQRSVQRRRRRL
jgi:HYR domain.